MRPVTKVILVLLLIATAGTVLWLASSRLDKTQPVKPSGDAVARGSEASSPGGSADYSDSRATVQRWRDYLSGTGKGSGETAGGGTPSGRVSGGSATEPRRGARRRDLTCSSRDEGTTLARGSDEAVAGADPPGPVLRPDGIVGEIIRGPLRGTRGADDASVYTVVAGDTLSGIATQQLGSARYVRAIQQANPGIDPDRLKPGDRLRLPDVASLEAKGPAAAPAPAPVVPQVWVVRRGDTLISIAKEYYGEASMYPRIYEANKNVLSSPNARLYVGQQLRMPEAN